MIFVEVAAAIGGRESHLTCSAKVLRSESHVHARDTVNDGAGETPSAGLRESSAVGDPRPRERHGQRRRG
jgi:hypothetical protein